MFQRLEEVVNKFEQIDQQLQDPSVTSDQKRYRQLMKDRAEMEEIVQTYRQYKKTKGELDANKSMLEAESDEELRRLIKDDIGQLEPQLTRLEEELKVLLIPKEENDDRNIIIEVRAGAGGDEASLFADELFRAYAYFANAKGWKVEIMSVSPGNVGGVKEIIGSITGQKVYSILKYESGVHRVQRVPKTEAAGRIHTSTVTVAVLPEADEVEVQINANDLKIDVFRAGGHGGQSVNTTDSAVRVTHLPTGLVVICQDEKSQLKNKNKAIKVLQARLLAAEQEKARKDASDARLAQIGTGDRSERIRTYNFPQSRVTDHRIGFTSHQIDAIMGGAMEHMIDPLITHFRAEALKQQQTGH